MTTNVRARLERYTAPHYRIRQLAIPRENPKTEGGVTTED